MSTKIIPAKPGFIYGAPEPVSQRVVRSVPIDRKHHQLITKIVSSPYYVYGAAKVLDVYDDLRGMEHVHAIGVVDEKMQTLGIILRMEFFSMLSRPFGRDVMKSKLILEAISGAELVDSETNLFTVAENIKYRMREPGDSYFVVTDRKKQFKGIFSTKDMLIYLSDMTQNDITLARKLQSRLVRESDFITGKNFEFVATAISAKGVAGDFYAIRKYGKQNWIISVCDVSGKGIAASIITSVLWGMINIYDFRNGMKKFIRELNSYLFQTFESEKFVTGIFIHYDDESQVLHICDLGHAYIHLFRQGRCMRIRGKHANLPLGIMPDIEPLSNAFRPQKGDMLFIYTDGLVDQENSERETYDIGRIGKIISGNYELPVEQLKELVLHDFSVFRGDRYFNDDITFSLVKFDDQSVVL
jgi:phosphoserine phosphatase RsbU/P